MPRTSLDPKHIFYTTFPRGGFHPVNQKLNSNWLTEMTGAFRSRGLQKVLFPRDIGSQSALEGKGGRGWMGTRVPIPELISV